MAPGPAWPSGPTTPLLGTTASSWSHGASRTRANMYERVVSGGRTHKPMRADWRVRAGGSAVEPDRDGLRAHAQAFGSTRVIAALQASSNTHERAIGCFDACNPAASKTSADDTVRGQGLPTAEARQAADDADDALIETIRGELLEASRSTTGGQARRPGADAEPPALS